MVKVVYFEGYLVCSILVGLFPIIYVFKNTENRLRRVILRLKICTNKCSSGEGLKVVYFEVYLLCSIHV